MNKITKQNFNTKFIFTARMYIQSKYVVLHKVPKKKKKFFVCLFPFPQPKSLDHSYCNIASILKHVNSYSG